MVVNNYDKLMVVCFIIQVIGLFLQFVLLNDRFMIITIGALPVLLYFNYKSKEYNNHIKQENRF